MSFWSLIPKYQEYWNQFSTSRHKITAAWSWEIFVKTFPNNYVEKQQKIIENQNDLILKVSEEKDQMQRDIVNLKKEMEIDRSRKYIR